MKVWLSWSEIVGLPGAPGSKRGVHLRAEREGWVSRPRKGRGGGREYHIDSLPDETRTFLKLQWVNRVPTTRATDKAPPASDEGTSYHAARLAFCRGTTGTIVDAEWANMVQEEIAAVIEGAGGELDKADREQLYDAIIALIGVASLETVEQAEAEAGEETTPRAWTAQRVAQAIAAQTQMIQVPKPQTVLSGPVDANGRAAFLSPTAGLDLTTDDFDTTPFVYTIANGFNANGEVNIVKRLTANVEFESLADDSSPNYLYLDDAESPGHFTGAYTQGYVFPSGPSDGDHHYMIGERQMYARESAAWVARNRVVIGEAVTESGAVTSVVSYAYMGRYVAAAGTPLTSNGVVSLNHNIGAPATMNADPLVFNANAGSFVTGDRPAAMYGIRSDSTTPTDLYAGGVVNNDNLSCEFRTTSSQIRLVDASGGSETVTATDLDFMPVIERIF